jgi:hypothetical protein
VRLEAVSDQRYQAIKIESGVCDTLVGLVCVLIAEQHYRVVAHMHIAGFTYAHDTCLGNSLTSSSACCTGFAHTLHEQHGMLL